MLGYVTLGSSNIEKSRAFYTALLAEIDMAEVFDNGRLYFYGTNPRGPWVVVGGPYDEQAASCGNGTMVALDCGSTEKVDALHAKAMELGAMDEGAPGNRMPTFYGAYARDPDGNKLCFYKMG